MPDAFAPTIRANDGVISGRNETALPPLSTNSKSCDFISSPLFSVKRSNCSNTGGSNSENPKPRADFRQPAKSAFFAAKSPG